MKQLVGTTKIHPFIVYDENGDEVNTALTNPVCHYSINGGEAQDFSPTLSYNTTMKSHRITIPSTLATNGGDTIEILIKSPEGATIAYSAHILIDIEFESVDSAILATEKDQLINTPRTQLGYMLWMIYKRSKYI
jgi:hypothetical protein